VGGGDARVGEGRAASGAVASLPPGIPQRLTSKRTHNSAMHDNAPGQVCAHAERLAGQLRPVSLSEDPYPDPAML